MRTCLILGCDCWVHACALLMSLDFCLRLENWSCSWMKNGRAAPRMAALGVTWQDFRMAQTCNSSNCRVGSGDRPSPSVCRLYSRRIVSRLALWFTLSRGADYRHWLVFGKTLFHWSWVGASSLGATGVEGPKLVFSLPLSKMISITFCK